MPTQKKKTSRGMGRKKRKMRYKSSLNVQNVIERDVYRPDAIFYEDWSLCHAILSIRITYRKSKAEYRVQRIGKAMSIRTGVNPVQRPCVGITNRQGVSITKGCPPNRMIAKSLAGIRMPIAKNKEFNKNGKRLKPRMGSLFTERDGLAKVSQDNVNVHILGMLNKDANSASRVAEWAQSMRAVREQNAILKYKSDPKNWTRGKHGGSLKLGG